MISWLNLLEMFGQQLKVRPAILGLHFPSFLLTSKGVGVHWMESWISLGLGFCQTKIKI